MWYLLAWSNQGTMLMDPIQGPPGYRSYHTAYPGFPIMKVWDAVCVS